MVVNVDSWHTRMGTIVAVFYNNSRVFSTGSA